jgi:hypothetical protein
MSRRRLIATVVFAVALFPLPLLIGGVQQIPALAPVAVPLAVVLTAAAIWALCRPWQDSADRLSTWVTRISPALGMAATAVAGVCWWCLEVGAYALAGIIFGDLPPKLYPLAVVGLLASATVLGWSSRRTGGWRLGRLLVLAIGGFIIAVFDELGTDQPLIGWTVPAGRGSAVAGHVRLAAPCVRDRHCTLSKGGADPGRSNA